MAVGKTIIGPIHSVSGVEIGVAQAAIKYANRDDVTVFKLCEGSQVAGVFTTNKFCAAPVHVAKAHLTDNEIRAWVVNTGNANAGTGAQGMIDASTMCAQVAEQMGVESSQVMPFSTGVIGETLPMDRLINGISQASQNIDNADWLRAADAIMTTDTVAKAISKVIVIDGVEIIITGIAKGSGMIKPNMATMLGFIATDANIDRADLQPLLANVVTESFNRVTVDGDTSTNDSCVAVATATKPLKLSAQHPSWALFSEAFEEVCLHLAQSLIRDGEGATKFVEVKVTGAATIDDALLVGYAIAESPLVKTALFASDPNWGRILAAVGRSGAEQLVTDRIDIYLDDVAIVECGGVAASYHEALGQAVFNKTEFCIQVELRQGDYTGSIWTSDLSPQYVSINADYRS